VYPPIGTGRPFVRARPGPIRSWLLRASANGDKFSFFDFGSGSQNQFPRLSKFRTRTSPPISRPTCTLTTSATLPQVWIGSWAGGRSKKPLVVYGPSGPEPRYGTKHFVRLPDGVLRLGPPTRVSVSLPDAGADVEVHEFDYRQTDVCLQPANGVVIRSFPCGPHLTTAPVKLIGSSGKRSLLHFFSGDTTA